MRLGNGNCKLGITGLFGVKIKSLKWNYFGWGYGFGNGNKFKFLWFGLG